MLLLPIRMADSAVQVPGRLQKVSFELNDERETPRVAPCGRAGLGAAKLGAQLVQPDAHLHEILAGARERPERLGRIAVGNQHPAAVTVGARQLREHEAVEAYRSCRRQR